MHVFDRSIEVCNSRYENDRRSFISLRSERCPWPGLTPEFIEPRFRFFIRRSSWSRWYQKKDAGPVMNFFASAVLRGCANETWKYEWIKISLPIGNAVFVALVVSTPSMKPRLAVRKERKKEKYIEFFKDPKEHLARYESYRLARFNCCSSDGYKARNNELLDIAESRSC